MLSTDIAPTILERLALPVPEEMSGRAIRAEGSVDPVAVEALGERPLGNAGAALLGRVLAATLGGRSAVAVAMAGGLVGIAVGRLTSEPDSTVTAVAAAAAALVVLLGAVWRHSRSAPRSAAVS